MDSLEPEIRSKTRFVFSMFFQTYGAGAARCPALGRPTRARDSRARVVNKDANHWIFLGAEGVGTAAPQLSMYDSLGLMPAQDGAVEVRNLAAPWNLDTYFRLANLFHPARV